MNLLYLCIVSLYFFTSTYCMTKREKNEMRETVIDMFQHAYNSYMTYAYPADELMPLSCKGRYHDTTPSRGDVDDILGNFSMTLIDSLDSLAIFGEIEKFDYAVKLVIENVQFDSDIVVSVFETNIRVLGGLLGGHVAADVLKKDGLAMLWYKDELLTMAKDMGERLLPAFNTTTGIPYPRVNLKYGVVDPRSRTGTESDTCTACAGTMIMEFGALSRLTGDPVFEAAAHKAMMALWTYRSRTSDLVGTVINIHNGEWVRRDSGVGAGIDSYYEYCLKAYILLGEEDYLQRFNQHYKAIMRYVNKGSMFLNVHMHNPSKSSYSYMDSLQAFWPGLQVLKGDLKSAIELHEVFYSVAKRHTFLPEAFTTNLEVHWGQHLLRPELVESTYFLYEATKDPYYLEVGKYIVENLNRYTRVPCGFAAVKDVRTLSHEDRMDSFLISETLKYLYLLFTEKNDMVIDIHDFVFTTEAHILPLGLSNWNGTSNQNTHFESEHLHDHSCPRTANNDNLMSFAEEIRRKSRSPMDPAFCPKPQQEKAASPTSQSSQPPLRAEQFIPGNTEHLHILKSMGISVTRTDDGKVQLMQNAAVADNTEMAAQGIKFMQSMIELAKFRSEEGGVEHLPRVVQILSPPYNGHIVLNAGPAQFGIDLAKSGMGVSAEVILADPFNGCTTLKNQDLADHRIVVMQRGECMFIDKVRQAESYGAVAAVIIDNNAGSSSESQPLFAMSGDGSSGDIQIPAVFLFANEGDILKKAMEIITRNNQGRLRIRLADKAKSQEVAKEESTSTSGEGQSSSETDKEQYEVEEGTNIEKETSEEPVEMVKKSSEAKLNILSDLNNVEKLMQLMKNVVNKPGFEFLNNDKKIINKISSLGKSDSKSREVWLRNVLTSASMDEQSLRKFLLKQKAAEELDLGALGETKLVEETCRSLHSQSSDNFKNVLGGKYNTKDKVLCGVVYENSKMSGDRDFIFVSEKIDDHAVGCGGGEDGKKAVVEGGEGGGSEGEGAVKVGDYEVGVKAGDYEVGGSEGGNVKVGDYEVGGSEREGVKAGNYEVGGSEGGNVMVGGYEVDGSEGGNVKVGDYEVGGSEGESVKVGDYEVGGSQEGGVKVGDGEVDVSRESGVQVGEVGGSMEIGGIKMGGGEVGGSEKESGVEVGEVDGSNHQNTQSNVGEVEKDIEERKQDEVADDGSHTSNENSDLAGETHQNNGEQEGTVIIDKTKVEDNIHIIPSDVPNKEPHTEDVPIYTISHESRTNNENYEIKTLGKLYETSNEGICENEKTSASSQEGKPTQTNNDDGEEKTVSSNEQVSLGNGSPSPAGELEVELY